MSLARTYLTGVWLYGLLALTGFLTILLSNVGAFGGIAIGGASGLLLSKCMTSYKDYKHEKVKTLVLGAMPKAIERHQNDDGTDTLIVERHDGSITTLITPEDYHPSQDGGSWVVEQLLPEQLRGEVTVEGRPWEEEDV